VGEKLEIISKVYLSPLLFRLEKQIIGLTLSITRLNTIISTKLGVVIADTDENKIA